MDSERTALSAPDRVYLGATAFWYEDTEPGLHDIEYIKKLVVQQLLADVLLACQKEMSARNGSTIHRKACDGIILKVLDLAEQEGLNRDLVMTYFLERCGERNLRTYLIEKIKKKALGEEGQGS